MSSAVTQYASAKTARRECETLSAVELALKKACEDAMGAPLSRMTVGALVQLLLHVDPSICAKMHEIDFEQRHPEYRVRDEKQGADLVHRVTNQPIEHKAVTVKNGKPGSVNFPIPVQKKGESLKAYEDRVYQEQKAKGDVFIEVKNGNGVVTLTTVLPARFIADYISNLPDLETRAKLVLNVSICKRCNCSHKLSHLEVMAVKYCDRKAMWDWDECYAPVSACVHPQ